MWETFYFGEDINVGNFDGDVVGEVVGEDDEDDEFCL